MSDLPQRLRAIADTASLPRSEQIVLEQAAAELDQLRAELARVRPVVDAARVLVDGWVIDETTSRVAMDLIQAVAGLDGDTATPQPADEDVPARVRAAADALDALDWAGTAYGLRDIASQLTPGDPHSDEGVEEAAAAVARALSTPTTDTPGGDR